MTLSSHIEQAVINDLSRDDRIAQFNPRPHDYPGSKSGDTPPTAEPQKLTITVSAREISEFFGTGIKRVGVQVELRASKAADSAIGNLLDEIESAVSARLQPSYTAPLPGGATGRENAFSGAQHKVFGITAEGLTRTESGLERVRVVNRTFIATLI